MNTPRLEPNAGSERLITMVTQDIPDGYKKCKKCGGIFERERHFYKRKDFSDGYETRCKTCIADYHRRYREENATIISQKKRQYAQRNAEKIKARNKQWRSDNQEKIRERNRVWKKEHPENARAYSRRRYYSDPERRQSEYKEWATNNPEKCTERCQRRKARKKNLITVSIPEILVYLSRIQNDCCLYCGKHIDSGKQLDHIIPIALADMLGSRHPGHTPPNLALACRVCNQSKNKTLPEDWLQRKFPNQMDEILHRIDHHIALMLELWDECGEDKNLWRQAVGLT